MCGFYYVTGMDRGTFDVCNKLAGCEWKCSVVSGESPHSADSRSGCQWQNPCQKVRDLNDK